MDSAETKARYAPEPYVLQSFAAAEFSARIDECARVALVSVTPSGMAPADAARVRESIVLWVERVGWSRVTLPMTRRPRLIVQNIGAQPLPLVVAVRVHNGRKGPSGETEWISYDAWLWLDGVAVAKPLVESYVAGDPDDCPESSLW